ncbi:MAG: tetratricopeptide repeat protein [Bryobacterales bacterium]
MRTLALILLCCCALGAQADPAALSEQGKQAMAQGRFADAAKAYTSLVGMIPDNPGLLLNLGMALHMSGQDAKAVPQFEKALSIAPDIYPALLFLGASKLRLGKPADAIEPLEKAVKLQPNELQPRQMLGDAYTQLGRLREALPHQIKITELAPTEPVAWAVLLQTYEGLAGESFEALEKAAPESAWMLRLVGDMRLAQRQYPSAFFLFQQATERDPSMRGLHAALAEIYRGTGKADWAEIETRKEAELPKADCKAARLECLVNTGLLQSAVQAKASTPEEYFWRAKAASMLASQAFAKLEALPDTGRKFELIAGMLAEQKRFDESASAWKKALELDPNNELYAEELAGQLYLSRQLDEALPRLEALAAKHPNEPRWALMLGDTYLQRQQIEKALPLLEKAAKAAPDMLTASHALGRAYMQMGEPEKAIPALQAALPIDVDGTLHYQLAQAYIQTGRRDEAAKPLAEYQKMQQAQREQLEAVQEMEITAPAQ